MRILVCHNWYREAGGEDAVVRADLSLLERAGHEVVLFAADSRRIVSPLDKVVTAASAPYSLAARKALGRCIARTRPDIVHVHNHFPLLTPSVFAACRRARVPAVHTLHNYRPLCPAATLSRSGRPCELCLDGSPANAVFHRCYRDSFAASAAAAWPLVVHRRLGTLTRRVDRLIALTEFQKSLFVRAGFDAARITVRPNWTPNPGDRRPPDDHGSYALFIGRLSREKGIETLLAAWRHVPIALRVAGSGPLESLVRDARNGFGGRLELLGHLRPEQVAEQLEGAAFLVMPSECYETFGMVLVEAFAHGVPVLASDLGAIAEIVDDGRTGLLHAPGDAGDLAAKARRLAEDQAGALVMGTAARRAFEARYTPTRGYESLMAVYEEVIAGARRH